MPCYVTGLLAVTDADVAPKKSVCKVVMPSDVNGIIKAQAHVYTNAQFGIHQPTIDAQHSMVARCALGGAGELIFDVLRCSEPLAKPAVRMPAEIMLTGEIVNCSSGNLLLKVSEYVANSGYEFKVLIQFNERMKKRYANFTPYLRVGNIIHVTAQLYAIHEEHRIMELTDADLNLVTGLRKKEKTAPIVDLTGKEWWELLETKAAATTKAKASVSIEDIFKDDEVTVVESTVVRGNASAPGGDTAKQGTDGDDDEDDHDDLMPKRRKLRGG